MPNRVFRAPDYVVRTLAVRVAAGRVVDLLVEIRILISRQIAVVAAGHIVPATHIEVPHDVPPKSLATALVDEISVDWGRRRVNRAEPYVQLECPLLTCENGRIMISDSV